jgi:hypothetical protein
MSEPEVTKKTISTKPQADITHSLAFVLDGEVVIVMGTDERHAAVFTSNPTVVPFTRTAENNPQLGWKWDGTNFTPPVSE